MSALRLRTLPARIRAGSLLIATIVAATFAASLAAFEQFKHASTAQVRLHRADSAANALQKLVVDVETGARGFVLTGQDQYLEPWQRARAEFPREAAGLASTLSGGAEAARLAALIQAEGTQYIRGFSEPLVRQAKRGREQALATVKSGRGKRLSDALRSRFAQLQRVLAAARRSEDKRANAASSRAGVATAAGLAVGLLIILAFAAYLDRHVSRPIRRIARATDRFASEGRAISVPEKGVEELAGLARSFNSMAESQAETLRRLEEQNRELEEARAAAAQADRAKTEFLSRVSHELRTPLNSILGFGQLLQIDEQDPKRQESVEYIVKGGRHLLQLIDEVLQLSRIESGTLSISPEAVALEPLLRDTLALMMPIAAERAVTVELTAGGGEAPFVFADQQRLKQVFLNVLSNAVKYNRDGGQIEIGWRSAPLDRVAVDIFNTGRGIDAEQLSRLFTPFERLGAEQTAVEGTGLGLALSKHLLTLMGGDLTVDSDPGVGTTFTVTVTRVEAPEHLDDAPALARIPARAAVGKADGGFAILYVEDNMSNYALLDRLLAGRTGVSLVSAIQGRRAIELARSQKPDLILLDLHLPDMSGERVLQALKSDPATEHIPVIVVSADATPHTVERVQAGGADRYLTKPFDVPALLSVLDDVLDERSASA